MVVNCLITIICVLVLFFVIVMIIDCNRFVKREYCCESGKLKREGTFVLLSDLHNKSFGKQNERLFRAIEQEKPDAILIAGDMYTSSAREDNQEIAAFVQRLAERYPVYYGNGNHEQKTRLFPEIFGDRYTVFADRICQAGVRLLVNDKWYLPDYNMEIYGLEVGREYYHKPTKMLMSEAYMEEMLGKADENRYNLLIAHNPEYFDNYAAWGADLTVSGHIHGGLMRLPVLGGVISPRLCLFPHYDGGRFTKAGREMILSRGLGTHTLPIRIFNPGELVVIHLKPKNR